MPLFRLMRQKSCTYKSGHKYSSSHKNSHQTLRLLKLKNLKEHMLLQKFFGRNSFVRFCNILNKKRSRSLVGFAVMYSVELAC